MATAADPRYIDNTNGLELSQEGLDFVRQVHRELQGPLAFERTASLLRLGGNSALANAFETGTVPRSGETAILAAALSRNAAFEALNPSASAEEAWPTRSAAVEAILKAVGLRDLNYDSALSAVVVRPATGTLDANGVPTLSEYVDPDARGAGGDWLHSDDDLVAQANAIEDSGYESRLSAYETAARNGRPADIELLRSRVADGQWDATRARAAGLAVTAVPVATRAAAPAGAAPATPTAAFPASTRATAAPARHVGASWQSFYATAVRYKTRILGVAAAAVVAAVALVLPQIAASPAGPSTSTSSTSTRRNGLDPLGNNLSEMGDAPLDAAATPAASPTSKSTRPVVIGSPDASSSAHAVVTPEASTTAPTTSATTAPAPTTKAPTTPATTAARTTTTHAVVTPSRPATTPAPVNTQPTHPDGGPTGSTVDGVGPHGATGNGATLKTAADFGKAWVDQQGGAEKLTKFLATKIGQENAEYIVSHMEKGDGYAAMTRARLHGAEVQWFSNGARNQKVNEFWGAASRLTVIQASENTNVGERRAMEIAAANTLAWQDQAFGAPKENVHDAQKVEKALYGGDVSEGIVRSVANNFTVQIANNGLQPQNVQWQL